MAEQGKGKRYYWLKLKEDYFNSPKIKKLRRLAGGDTLTVIYLKMQLLSVKNKGKIDYEGIEDTFADELALKLDEDKANIELTLAYLEAQKLIEISEDSNEYLLIEANNSVGSECESAERVRLFRKNEKALQCNTSVTKCNDCSISSSISNSISNIDDNIDDKDKNDPRFEQFWGEYPKKVDKKGCCRAFARIPHLNSEFEKIMEAVRRDKRSYQWQANGGQYIPNPKTYINQERWKSQTQAPKSAEVVQKREYTTDEKKSVFDNFSNLDLEKL